jgi:glycosyltransferase involved in cell wall biosynthesis
MNVCAISFKPCWQDDSGRWVSDGGFPLQMTGIRSLFDEMTLIITGSRPGGGGIPLPADVTMVPIRLPDGWNLRRKISFLWNILYYVRIITPHIRRTDVVHLPLPGDIPFLGIVIAILFRKRVIVRYGSSWVGTSQETMMTRLTKFIMRSFAGGRNVMITTGEGTVPPARRVSWIFSTALTSAELDSIPFDPARGLSSPPGLAYVGRLSGEKGVGNLIAALEILAQEGHSPMPQCWIIGDGPERVELEEKVVRAGLSAHIRFAGQLDRSSLSALLQKLDFCVQPSLSEGFSKAWLDAFAHGLPVLASEVGAAKPVIGGDGLRGWLVPPGDVRALSAQLRRVLADPIDWPSVRRRCREYTEKRTLETWSAEIGRICASQWDMRFVGGKIRP